MARPTLFQRLTRTSILALVVAGAVGALVAAWTSELLVETDRTRLNAETGLRAAMKLEAYDLNLLLSLRRNEDLYRDKTVLDLVEREHALDALEHLLGSSPEGASSLAAVRAYRGVSERVLALIRFLGFKDHGLEGVLRAAAHRLEDRLPDPQARIDLLELRRHEKDFFLRGGLAPLGLNVAAAARLHASLTADPEARVDLDVYAGAFGTYVRGSRLLGDSPREGLLLQQADARAVAEHELAAWARRQNDKIARLVTRARWLWGVSLPAGLVVFLIAGWLITRSLRDDLLRVGDAARRIGRGEMNIRASAQTSAEVGVVADAVNDMADDLEHAERLVLARTAQLERTVHELDAFCSSVSHDLRAPLRAMSGFATALSRDHGADLPPAGREHILRIQNASVRMDNLVTDLLRLSRINRTALRWERVDLSALAFDIGRQLAVEPDTVFEVEPGMVVDGDRGLLEAALTNLVSNALKFSRGRKPSRVEIGRDPDEPHTFFVRDNGVGFEMEYADKLFRIFQRLHGREFDGTGVGLATVKRVIERHGGHVRAHAEPGAGATFWFSLSPTFPADEELAHVSQSLPML